MAIVREWEGAYECFFYYFTHNMDIIKTVKAYNLSTKSDKASMVSTWSALKKKYPSDYLDAKNSYLEMVGIHQVSILERVYDIAINASLDRDKLKALEILSKYYTEVADSSLISAGNRLTIEVVPTPSEPQLLAEDIVYYNDHEFPEYDGGDSDE